MVVISLKNIETPQEARGFYKGGYTWLKDLGRFFFLTTSLSCNRGKRKETTQVSLC